MGRVVVCITLDGTTSSVEIQSHCLLYSGFSGGEEFRDHQRLGFYVHGLLSQTAHGMRPEINVMKFKNRETESLLTRMITRYDQCSCARAPIDIRSIYSEQ